MRQAACSELPQLAEKGDAASIEAVTSCLKEGDGLVRAADELHRALNKARARAEGICISGDTCDPDGLLVGASPKDQKETWIMPVLFDDPGAGVSQRRRRGGKRKAATKGCHATPGQALAADDPAWGPGDCKILDRPVWPRFQTVFVEKALGRCSMASLWRP